MRAKPAKPVRKRPPSFLKKKISKLKDTQKFAIELNGTPYPWKFREKLDEAFRQHRLTRTVLFFLRREIKKCKFPKEEKKLRLTMLKDYRGIRKAKKQ